MKKIHPSDWVEYNGQKSHVIGVSTLFTGEQIVYLQSSEPSAKKLKEYLKDGGVISALQDMMEVSALKVNLKEVKLSSSPKIDFKVGDLIYSNTLTNSVPVKVTKIQDQTIWVEGGNTANFNFDPNVWQKSNHQIGDLVQMQPTHSNFNFLQQTYGTDTFKVSGVALDGMHYLSSEKDRSAENLLIGSHHFLAGKDDGKSYMTSDKSTINDPMFFKKVITQPNTKILSNHSYEPKTSLKDNAKDALYRIGARKINKASQKLLINICKKHGLNKKQLDAIGVLLETDYGQAFISYILGISITYLPGMNDNNQVQRIAEEFRVEGLAVAGDALIGDILDQCFGMLSSTIKSLPEVKIETSKVEEKDSEILEENEEIILESSKMEI